MNPPCDGALPLCEGEGVKQACVNGSAVRGVKSLRREQERRWARRAARAGGPRRRRARLPLVAVGFESLKREEIEREKDFCEDQFSLCLFMYAAVYLSTRMWVNRAGPRSPPPPVPEMKNNKNIFT